MNFVNRRSDVTGGHIMKIPKKLKPKKLPSLYDRTTDVDDSCTFGGTTGGSYANSTIKTRSILTNSAGSTNESYDDGQPMKGV